ncbi:AraC-type DNA-binding protein [Palleronia marisminoris]|uniref:Arabinose operon regulatory protein n=1 Tax=Palleronia marisminoris TaxID=315423 RepID=A0A1Y5R8P4_9RHOB|nr:AraC family transcriptional regulator [Palleronia marisminoris]SFG07984.1 AraC-type DNA-binding protein [Palleronia marisminoris]SLN11328.1 Arabinose operon regulatory protein [Palleronia marisminoris]
MLDTARPEAGLKIVSLAQIAAGGRWRTEAMRAYAQPMLYWFTRGQGRITAQGVTRSYGPHDAIILPPNTMHGFDTNGSILGHAVFLPATSAEDMPDAPLHLRVREATEQADLTRQIENIRIELDRGEASSQVALGHHVGLLVVWLERIAGEEWDAEAEIDGRSAESLAGAYTALLETHFRGGYTISDYARALGVTPAHLTRCCRRASGRSASDLLLDRLHFEARRLLSETRMPINKVAETLGFRSAAYFSRAFRARTGHTPRDFRRRV